MSSELFNGGLALTGSASIMFTLAIYHLTGIARPKVLGSRLSRLVLS